MRPSELAYVLALGVGLGLVSAHLAVAERPLIGSAAIGAWTVWPSSGARTIDPYMRAHLARGVHLPFGVGEGVELVATRDDDGRGLDGRCTYRIFGATPTSRGWTLSVSDAAGRPFSLPLGRDGFSDAEVLRDESGQLDIAASAAPQPDNWLPLPASGGFRLTLRLYDTPISSQAGEWRAQALPAIQRTACR